MNQTIQLNLKIPSVELFTIPVDPSGYLFTFFRGNTLDFEISLLNPDGSVFNVSQVQKVTIEAKRTHGANPPRPLDPLALYAETETIANPVLLTIPDSQTGVFAGTYWFSVTIFGTGGGVLTAASQRIFVKENGEGYNLPPPVVADLRDEARAAANDAETARDTAVQSAHNASVSAGLAEGYKDDAETAAGLAEGYRDEARQAAYDATVGLPSKADKDAGNVSGSDIQAWQTKLGRGANNGLASLDGSGKVPSNQLPSPVMELKGDWDASANDPHLADGVGNAGDVYICTVAGTTDFGSGGIQFNQYDLVLYTGSQWIKIVNADLSGLLLKADKNASNLTQADIQAWQILGSESATAGTIVRRDGNATIHLVGTEGIRQSGSGTAIKQPDYGAQGVYQDGDDANGVLQIGEDAVGVVQSISPGQTGVLQTAKEATGIVQTKEDSTGISQQGVNSIGISTTGSGSKFFETSGANADQIRANSRTELGLGDSSTLNVGTTVGTVAAGDDSRITGALQPGDNVSDLVNDAGYITSAPPAPVQSVAGKTGSVTLTKADVGLSNVDNTSDANKPVSTPAQNALNLKANLNAGNLTLGHREAWSKKLGGVQWIDGPLPLGDPYNLNQATPRYVVVGMPDDSDVCEIEFFESDFYNQQVITIANVGKGTVKLVGDTKAVLLPGDTLTFTQLDDILYTIEHTISTSPSLRAIVPDANPVTIPYTEFGRINRTILINNSDQEANIVINLTDCAKVPPGSSVTLTLIDESGATAGLYTDGNYKFIYGGGVDVDDEFTLNSIAYKRVTITKITPQHFLLSVTPLE